MVESEGSKVPKGDALVVAVGPLFALGPNGGIFGRAVVVTDVTGVAVVATD